MIIQIAICDDNETERSILLNMVKEIMGEHSIPYKIIEFDSGEKLLASKLQFNLIFLDIVMDGKVERKALSTIDFESAKADMGYKNGIEIGKQIYRNNHNIKIIFQTNYGQYCKDAMNSTHAYAFLEKPLQKCEVKKQLEEFIYMNESNQEISLKFLNVRSIENGKEIKNNILHIPVNSILYFEVAKLKRELKIITEGKEFKISEVFNKLESDIKHFGFETSSRGYLVNLKNVQYIKGYSVYLKNGHVVPLSQRRVREFKERLNDYIHSDI